MRHVAFLAALPLAAALVACGGGGGSSSGGSVTPPVTLDPTVIVSAITTPAMGGLSFKTCGNGASCLTDKTDSSGSFKMVKGGTLDFLVGKLTVIHAPDTSKAITSAFQLSATGDETDQTFVNQMTLLYSLDEDGDPSNGISISDKAQVAVAATNVTTIDFNVASDVFRASPVVQTVVNAANAADVGASVQVRDPEAVRAALHQMLFTQKFGGAWTLTMDDSSSSTQAVTVNGNATATASGLTFTLDTSATDSVGLRFYRSDLGSFMGKLKPDGTGTGTWSKGTGAGFWKAARATATQ